MSIEEDAAVPDLRTTFRPEGKTFVVLRSEDRISFVADRGASSISFVSEGEQGRVVHVGADGVSSDLYAGLSETARKAFDDLCDAAEAAQEVMLEIAPPSERKLLAMISVLGVLAVASTVGIFFLATQRERPVPPAEMLSMTRSGDLPPEIRLDSPKGLPDLKDGGSFAETIKSGPSPRIRCTVEGDEPAAPSPTTGAKP